MISMKEVPRCASAAARIPERCFASVSMLRATKVAPEPSAKASGLKGRSIDPIGVDFFTVPTGLVGEYCPLVRP